MFRCKNAEITAIAMPIKQKTILVIVEEFLGAMKKKTKELVRHTHETTHIGIAAWRKKVFITPIKLVGEPNKESKNALYSGSAKIAPRVIVTSTKKSTTARATKIIIKP
ncbi:MAG TPA: hypothetical protein PKO28_04140 [Bacilli bacterium]|nr:hypothetical protein [Bacilli bacterium]